MQYIVLYIVFLILRNDFLSAFFVDRAMKANIDASTAMFLVSVIGIGNTIGRIVCGLASSLPGVNALVVNNIFISVGGLVTMLSGLSLTEGYQFFYAASFGLSICKQNTWPLKILFYKCDKRRDASYHMVYLKIL